jgi:HTH-type transcriptional regulator, global nitrogen regulator NrpRI
METIGDRKVTMILRILAEAGRPLGSSRIASELSLGGVDLKQRMVRYYLSQMDKAGLSESLGRGGRRITQQGMDMLRTAIAVERVGYVSSRMDELSYKMSFDRILRSGTVILNISRLRAADFGEAQKLIAHVLEAGLGMGKLLALGRDGDELGGYRVPFGEVAVGTVCSVTLNGLFRSAGVPITPRFGGLLELRDGRPVRFTHIIHYDGTTIDPVEIFIKGRLTRVREAAAKGSGVIGASFREIPAAALPAATQLMEDLVRAGLLGRVHVLGRPGQPLLDIPVAQGRVGLVVSAGLNPIAAVEEAGIDTQSQALATLHEFGRLISAARLSELLATSRTLHKRLTSLIESRSPSRDGGIFE